MYMFIKYVIMYLFKQNKSTQKKNLLWFYLRSPDILSQDVSCNIIKGDALKKEDLLVSNRTIAEVCLVLQVSHIK